MLSAHWKSQLMYEGMLRFRMLENNDILTPPILVTPGGKAESQGSPNLHI